MKKKPIWNPINPFDNIELAWDEKAPLSSIQVWEDETKGVLSKNKSSDIPFEYSLNPYRGCTHACAYCYARRTHEYLGMGSGTDFETRIVAKTKAPELLRKKLMTPSWTGKRICLSGVTDPYQPLEGRYKITRQCLEICAEFHQPVVILTRSPLIVRDIDILENLAQVNAVVVYFSIPILDERQCQLMEPGTASPRHRFKAMKALSDVGIPTGVSVSPIIPGVNIRGIPDILKKAKESGAAYSFSQLLRLPGSVETYFTHHIQNNFPLKANKILNTLKRMRKGAVNSMDFGVRRGGEGPEWEMAKQLYTLWYKKLGYQKACVIDDPTPFRRPGSFEQLKLY
jgi:DNA repair photolyase